MGNNFQTHHEENFGLHSSQAEGIHQRQVEPRIIGGNTTRPSMKRNV